MARRGHGEGSIYRRKDGRWVGAIMLEDRKRKYFYGETPTERYQARTLTLEQARTLLETARGSRRNNVADGSNNGDEAWRIAGVAMG